MNKEYITINCQNCGLTIVDIKGSDRISEILNRDCINCGEYSWEEEKEKSNES